jgi:hypothetical protein
MFLACEKRHVEVVQLLVDHMGGQGLEGVLHTVARLSCLTFVMDTEANEQMIRILLWGGADPDATDRNGKTPRAILQDDGNRHTLRVFEVSPHVHRN